MADSEEALRIPMCRLKHSSHASSFVVLLSICCYADVVRAADAQWDPPAVSDFPKHSDYIVHPEKIDELIQIGRKLFVAKFTPLDWAGRPVATGDSKPTTRSVDHSIFLTRIAGPDAVACSSCHIEPSVGGSGDFSANVFVGAHFSDPPTMVIEPRVTNERN